MLQVSPDEVTVEGPFDRERRTVFSLFNRMGENQVFKIKSTAPDIIGLSPSSGFIKPYERIEVIFDDTFRTASRLASETTIHCGLLCHLAAR